MSGPWGTSASEDALHFQWCPGGPPPTGVPQGTEGGPRDPHLQGTLGTLTSEAAPGEPALTGTPRALALLRMPWGPPSPDLP